MFTFFSEEVVVVDPGSPAPSGPEVEILVDLDEIERVVEADITLFAAELGLDAIVEMVFRLGGWGARVCGLSLVYCCFFRP